MDTTTSGTQDRAPPPPATVRNRRPARLHPLHATPPTSSSSRRNATSATTTARPGTASVSPLASTPAPPLPAPKTTPDDNMNPPSTRPMPPTSPPISPTTTMASPARGGRTSSSGTHRRLSVMSSATTWSDMGPDGEGGMLADEDPLAETTPAARAKTHRSHKRFSALVLATALVPIALACFVKNGERAALDALGLALVLYFAYYSVMLPWEWHADAHRMRVLHADASGLAARADALAAEWQSGSDASQADDSDAPPPSMGSVSSLAAHAVSPAGHIRSRRWLAARERGCLFLCFAVPLLASCALIKLRNALGLSPGGLVAMFNVPAYFIATQLKLLHHLVDTINSRMRELERSVAEEAARIAAAAAQVVRPPPLGPSGADVTALAEAVAALTDRMHAAEAHMAALQASLDDVAAAGATASEETTDRVAADVGALKAQTANSVRRLRVLAAHVDDRLLALNTRVAHAEGAAKEHSALIRSVLAPPLPQQQQRTVADSSTAVAEARKRGLLGGIVHTVLGPVWWLTAPVWALWGTEAKGGSGGADWRGRGI